MYYERLGEDCAQPWKGTFPTYHRHNIESSTDRESNYGVDKITTVYASVFNSKHLQYNTPLDQNNTGQYITIIKQYYRQPRQPQNLYMAHHITQNTPVNEGYQ